MDQKAKYERLFTPGKIGNVSLKNRIVMPAMGTGFPGMNGEVNDKIMEYYIERAKGGCGLIISEICRVDDEHGVGLPNQLCMTDIKQVYPMENLVEAIHRYGAKFFIQLHHPGRQTKSALMNGREIIAPSPIACKVTKEMPREMTTEECQDMVKKFVRGAVFASFAGVDGVELHAAHGYLLDQFLSPYTNHRTDAYGGSFENRMRILDEIIFGIKKMCPGMPISVRLSVDEFIEGGIHVEEGVKIAQHLEALGVDAINVSSGTYESGMTVIEPYNFAEAWKKHLGLAIKQAVSIPVIAVNNLKHPAMAEQMLEENVCDFVGLARAQLADPEFANKARKGQDDEICNCISCMYCFREEGLKHRLKCAVNPRVGREDVYKEINVNGENRPVAVLGGGPAGMTAAITLADRGFQVTLYEKYDKLGGALNLASLANKKELVKEYCDYLVGQVQKRDIKVVTNHEVTLDELETLDPYAVFSCIGGRPIVVPIAGIEKMQTLVWDQILRDHIRPTGKKIVVVGGGVTGLETAEILSEADLQNEVKVVEMKAGVAELVYPSVKYHLVTTLKENQVDILVNQKVVGASENQVILENTQTGEKTELDADLLVFASGVHPDPDWNDSLYTRFANVALCGDSVAAGSILEANRDAYEKAMVLE